MPNITIRNSADQPFTLTSTRLIDVDGGRNMTRAALAKAVVRLRRGVQRLSQYHVVGNRQHYSVYVRRLNSVNPTLAIGCQYFIGDNATQLIQWAKAATKTATTARKTSRTDKKRKAA